MPGESPLALTGAFAKVGRILHQTAAMNRRLFIVIAVLASFAGALCAKKPGPHSPIEEARDHLEHAHSMLTAKEEGAGGKKKRKKVSIPGIINVLSNAETSLAEAKNNKGTNTNVALKNIADAKTELEASKSGDEEAHLQKAEAAIDEALKHVMEAIRVS